MRITFICEAGALKVRPNLDGLLGQLTLDIVNQDLHNNNHFHTKKSNFPSFDSIALWEHSMV